jgi:hypothetical protein
MPAMLYRREQEELNYVASYKRIQFLAARKVINFHIFAIATI